MDANAYFDSIYFETNFLRTKITDIIRAIEKTPGPAKSQVAPQLPRLRFLARYLDKRMEKLWSKRPIDWMAEARELEKRQEWPEEAHFAAYASGFDSKFLDFDEVHV